MLFTCMIHKSCGGVLPYLYGETRLALHIRSSSWPGKRNTTCHYCYDHHCCHSHHLLQPTKTKPARHVSPLCHMGCCVEESVHCPKYTEMCYSVSALETVMMCANGAPAVPQSMHENRMLTVSVFSSRDCHHACNKCTSNATKHA